MKFFTYFLKCWMFGKENVQFPDSWDFENLPDFQTWRDVHTLIIVNWDFRFSVNTAFSIVINKCWDNRTTMIAAIFPCFAKFASLFIVSKRYSTNERTPLSVPMSPSHSEYLKFVNKGPSAQDNVKWWIYKTSVLAQFVPGLSVSPFLLY